jgi:hypothetical protein
MPIGAYFINAYCWLFYQWLFVAILLMNIRGFFINDYCGYPLMVILVMAILLMVIY